MLAVLILWHSTGKRSRVPAQPSACRIEHESESSCDAFCCKLTQPDSSVQGAHACPMVGEVAGWGAFDDSWPSSEGQPGTARLHATLIELRCSPGGLMACVQACASC